MANWLIIFLVLLASPGWAAQVVGDRYNDYRQPMTTVDTSNNEVKPGDAANNAINVNVVAGGAGDGSILDGVSSAIKATVKDLTNSNPLTVAITDANGDQITSFGGGTQYTEGDVDATITGTALLWEDTGDTLRPVSAAKPLPVNITNGSVPVTGALTDSQLRATPVPVSGTVTVTDGAGALNVIVDSGTVGISGSVAVTGPLTDAQLRATPVPVSGTVTVTDGAGALNVIVDSGTTTVTQSTATNLNAAVVGTGTAGSPAGNILTVQGVASMTKLLVTPDSVALPANQSVNVNQIGGSAVSTATTGVQKVGVVGNAGAIVDAANNAAAPANVLVPGWETATQTVTQPTAATAGNVRRPVASTDGALYVRKGGPVMWQCNLGAIGTTLTQCQAAPGAGLRLYITDILAVSSTTTSGLFTLRFGTGANCGTGTGNVFFASAAATLPNGANNATSVKPWSFTTPIAITANNAVCVLGVVTNTTNIQISGYTAP